MNYALVFSLIGMVLRIEAALMAIPLAVALIYREDVTAFVCSMVIVGAVSLALTAIRPKDAKMRARDGFLIAALSWIFISLFGALPFCFSGCFPSVVDCIFESTSGFTTTGATVLSELEELPRGIMFWRMFSHWVGGLGVLVFILAVMPNMSASSVNLLKVESTGPAKGKMLPKVRETAKHMYLIYLTLTVAAVLALTVAGMPFYDALTHSFTIAGTGGFSTRTMSVAAYDSQAIEYVFAVFLLLFGVNFTIFFHIVRKEFKLALHDEELYFYFAMVGAAVAVIFLDLIPYYDSAGDAFRYSVFQVPSVITTTCVSTVDYNLWPTFSKLVLMFIMITGCCAGSTGGGIKLVRVLLLIKSVRAELDKVLHPNVVKPIVVNKRAIDEKIISKVFMFFFAYFAVMIVAILIVSLDDFDLVTTVTSVIGLLSNAGPGLGEAGPTGTFAQFSPLSKLVMSFCMLAGRLELFPALLLLAPSTWRRSL